MPPALKNRPELQFWLRPFWEAFQVLTLSRPNNGFSLGPIRLQEILAYAELIGMQDLEARQDLIRFIQAMDRVFLEHNRGNRHGSA